MEFFRRSKWLDKTFFVLGPLLLIIGITSVVHGSLFDLGHRRGGFITSLEVIVWGLIITIGGVIHFVNKKRN
ncbi:MAG TPA: hypothetical protein VGQ59_09750 [Cyclobacteriaceae bacterium]|nr:hypothetical protein [Cyclobacteriaceae bacterium]